MEIVSDVAGFAFEDDFVNASDIQESDEGESYYHPNSIHRLTECPVRSLADLEKDVDRQLDLVDQLCSDPTSNCERQQTRREPVRELDLTSLGENCFEVAVDVTMGVAVIDGRQQAIRPGEKIRGSFGNDRYSFSNAKQGDHFVVLGGRGWNILDLRGFGPEDIRIEGETVLVGHQDRSSNVGVPMFSIEIQDIGEILLSEERRISLVPVPGIGLKENA